MTDEPTEPRYRERYAVPLWFWPAGLLLGALLAALFDGPLSRYPGWPAYVVVLGLVVAGLWWCGRIRVAVTDTELTIDDARLPRSVIATVEPLTPEDKRRLLSVDAHPLAFVIQRPWIPGAVRIVLDDPDDPTPYWIISSRHPHRLADALRRTADQRV
ncbi:DUF3093 domain-containing protein [Actinocatenispora thailandica]|uniref:DUF3093 domain-containing protein n=1 Tax=Actinocatenispora thailandica TaxID=227318 RepID=UPI001951645C|nr:DUF3093 domain-containing protein [Actinocatenispora thailandica]